MSDSTDDDCPPCNNLLSPPPTSLDCKASFVFKTQLKCGDSSKYGDSGLVVSRVTEGPVTLEQIKHSCEFSGHEETLRELGKKYNKEILREFVRQLGKLDSGGRIDWNGTVADVVLEIDIVPELLSQDERCAICLESVPDNEGNFLPCSHMYHGNCLRQWLSRKLECPLCRFLLSKPHSGLHK